MTSLPERQSLPVWRWLGPLAVLCSVVLVPWTIYLGLTLPAHADADHYDVAWVGFDAAMCIVLAGCGYCALRRSTALEIFAAVSATMLLVDAWFDLITASTRSEILSALLLALVAEVPLALICAWTAVNAERVRMRRYRRIRDHLHHSGHDLPEQLE
jgi:hypothetical protein